MSGRTTFAAVLLLLAACSPTSATRTLQAQIDDMAKTGGVVEIPAGTYDGDLRLPTNVSLEGTGRQATVFTGSVIVTGTAMQSTFEIDHAGRIANIGFEGSGTCLTFDQVAFFEVAHASFRGCEVGVHFAGSLQARIDDSVFVGNGTGLLLTAEPSRYYAGPVLPPSRVLVSWSTFFENRRGLDYTGGEQIIVRDSEFGYNGVTGDAESGAIWVAGNGDPGGPGLVAEGLWMEGNHGRAVFVLSGPVVHSIRDTWMAYTDAEYAVAVDGELVCENVRYDPINTVTGVLGRSC